ncbi:MAG: SDR family NAD(P)-dependent oxidoreductase, partial [Mesorhizobium sp.]
QRLAFLPLDVTKEASVRAFVDEVVQNFGRIDILVKNARSRPSHDAKIVSVCARHERARDTWPPIWPRSPRGMAPLRGWAPRGQRLKGAASAPEDHDLRQT